MLGETKAVRMQRKLEQRKDKIVLFLTNNDDSSGKQGAEWEWDGSTAHLQTEYLRGIHSSALKIIEDQRGAWLHM